MDTRDTGAREPTELGIGAAASDACLDANAAVAFIEGDTSDEERARVLAHLDACDACREFLSALARRSTTGSASARGQPAPVRLGELVGRYRLLELVGVGGQATVFAAYDPELRRNVAIKLLHLGHELAPTNLAIERLLREGQAIARLSHPNVVAVHDLGRHAGTAYIAMELVDAGTLSQWLAAAERRTAEIVDVFVQVALGLVAVHAQGLVHGDFKPHNVLCGKDGRVHVADFGMSRDLVEAGVLGLRASGSSDDADSAEHHASRPDHASPEHRASRPDHASPEHHASRPDHASRTAAGTVMGTVAYMAPEQYRGERAGPAADQYAYCVALYEALYGVRPFAGDDLGAMARAKLRGVPQTPPRTAARRVPSWLHAVLMRGLAPAADARWPSMQALLHALMHGRARSRRRLLFAAATGIAAIAVAVAGVRELDERRRIAACEAEGASMDASWNDDAREALRAGLVATGVSHAAQTAEKTMPWLDQQAAAWTAARTEACLLADVQRAWDQDMHERAQWCLSERRMELEALVDELSRAGAEGVDKAVTGAAGLAQIEPCIDADRLARLPAPPVREAREAIEAVRAELSRAGALEAAGQYDAALAGARAALEHARELEWPPLVAAAQLLVGRVNDAKGDYAEAEAELEEAYFLAAAAGEVELAAQASISLVHTVGYKLARAEDGRRWSRIAELGMNGLPPDEAGLLGAHLDGNLAVVHHATGAYAQAQALHERALAIWERTLGPDHPEVATALNNLAVVHHATGAYAQAEPLYERALAIYERALGPQHPDVATTLNNLAEVQRAMGAYKQAQALLERALAIRERALGPEHPDVAMSLSNLGLVHDATGAYAEAQALLERALAIYERALGPEHPDVATTLSNLADVHQAMGAYAQALALHERALAIREQALGPNHPSVAISLNNLGTLHSATGAYKQAQPLFERALNIWERELGPNHPNVATSLHNLAKLHEAMRGYTDAQPLFERALNIWERELGPNHPNVANALVGLAENARAQHRTADAVALARRAVAIREHAQVPAPKLATARMMLARALWDEGSDRSEARRLAIQAAQAFEAAGSAHVRDLKDARTWLSRHAAPR